ncbi:hypothetical protein PHLCEN_2v11861 [Hermanssonia centrifuga]|uniref:Uncharacterized protein n=1 Tax=Hermanssonia centrifuga TaxID=98765 RepID=A0A2R6NIS5_9APHY|nr:hypothetical protein PHLCEN_2v11861 [Hermanssonia centrifuga]
MDDSTTLEIAKAWPRLKILQLIGGCPAAMMTSHVTLRGLEHLVKHCRHLEALRCAKSD